ncbi:MAG: c-type cytochrome domain-containing protein [Chthonomonadales bacterium]
MIRRVLPVAALMIISTVTVAQADVKFSRDIAPILIANCIGCHGERSNAGSFRAHNYQSLMRAGRSGLPSIVPGQPEKSNMLKLLLSTSPTDRMPSNDDPLKPAQLAAITTWIKEGAKFDGSDPAANLKSLVGPRQFPAAPATYRTTVPVLAIAFVPGSTDVALGGYNEVTIWNSTSGALKRRIDHLPQRIQALTFTRDGKSLLVTGGVPGEYGETSLVNMQSGERSVISDALPDIALAAAFSPDEKTVAVGGADASVTLYEVATHKRIWSNKVHSDWVTSLSFSPDGHFLASASKDMTIKIYEVANGSLFTTYSGHNRQIGKYRGAAPVWAVRFAPDEQIAYSAGGGKWIQVWDPVKARDETGDAGDMEERFAKQGHARYYETGFEHEVFALAISGPFLFASSADGLVKQFELKTGTEIRKYPGHQDWVFGLATDAASGRMASGSYDGEVRIWDTKTGQLVVKFIAKPA